MTARTGLVLVGGGSGGGGRWRVRGVREGGRWGSGLSARNGLIDDASHRLGRGAAALLADAIISMTVCLCERGPKKCGGVCVI